MEVLKVNIDISIYLTQWGCCVEDMRWVCESNKTGLIHVAFHTYQEAAMWCESRGYSHD